MRIAVFANLIALVGLSLIETAWLASQETAATVEAARPPGLWPWYTAHVIVRGELDLASAQSFCLKVESQSENYQDVGFFVPLVSPGRNDSTSGTILVCFAERDRRYNEVDRDEVLGRVRTVIERAANSGTRTFQGLMGPVSSQLEFAVV